MWRRVCFNDPVQNEAYPTKSVSIVVFPYRWMIESPQWLFNFSSLLYSIVDKLSAAGGLQLTDLLWRQKNSLQVKKCASQSKDFLLRYYSPVTAPFRQGLDSFFTGHSCWFLTRMESENLSLSPDPDTAADVRSEEAACLFIGAIWRRSGCVTECSDSHPRRSPTPGISEPPTANKSPHG